MSYTQVNRRIAISTPLGKDVLLLRGFTGSEGISQLFHFDLDLLSENDSIKFQDLVGKNVTLRIFDAEGAERHWNGFINRFSQGSQDRRLTSYSAQMVPWLWFLTRTADCRIFQNLTVPDIIQKIFADLKFQDFELRLYGSFTPRDYCVQYRETDFNFVSRLMEEEGIFYYFNHEDGKHVLILGNDPAAHEPCPGQKTARYDFRGGAVLYEDVITEWHYQEEFRPGAWAQTDYNFETPSTNLEVTVKGANPYEIYEYPGEHRIRDDGEKLSRIRLQEQAAPCVVSHGASGCRHFTSGLQFTLQDHYRKDLNVAYLITTIHHVATQDQYQVGGGGGDGGELSYHNRFQCIPFSTPFRPQRVTAQPLVQGCQTAVVVGPAGEEIYTDKYGRVKVQFHWDREGKKNENSSCWIRVSHPWAGKGYGSVSIPRIDQEVIVDFLEGDPDQPIIVGRVYNAEQMPPNGLPKAGMVSGVKSNSTPGGGGSNEMSMDDTKGKEKITVHGQYDMATTIEHDDTQTIHNNRTITVDGTHTETVTGVVTEHYKADQKTTVDGTNTETVTGAVTENYKNSQTTTVNQAIVVTSETAHIYIHTATNIQLHVGASKLWMASDGNISLEGVNVTISGSSGVYVKGQVVHSEATAEHQTKGAIVISEGSATNTVKGGMVMLNP
ncbi:MAG TPA: type VI secretion system tip protein TssI/VgrG [Terriglobia bacterium]|nr:type VI secretion system tip protein TssI/VgrG [Terriglobia bacterium]